MNSSKEHTQICIKKVFKQIIRQFFLVFPILCFVGCSATLPSKSAEFSDFTITQRQEITKETVKKSANYSFEFPADCEWLPLTRIVDGDTIVVDETIRVRLIGIDTPETKHPRRPIEPFGLAASAFTKKLLKNSAKVCLVSDPIGDIYDKYGRRLAYIFSQTGADVNAELLNEGLAKAYPRFPFARKAEFVALESQAKMKKVGQWEN